VIASTHAHVAHARLPEGLKFLTSEVLVSRAMPIRVAESIRRGLMHRSLQSAG